MVKPAGKYFNQNPASPPANVRPELAGEARLSFLKLNILSLPVRHLWGYWHSLKVTSCALGAIDTRSRQQRLAIDGGDF
jgi:hypothetical protein